MTGKLNNARNSSVIKRKKINQIFKKISMQYQRRECLMDIQSETKPNSLQQITVKKTLVH